MSYFVSKTSAMKVCIYWCSIEESKEMKVDTEHALMVPIRCDCSLSVTDFDRSE
jgi:hypothetical protein